MGVVNKTIMYKGVELDIEFYFSPSEPAIMYDSDLGGHPGGGEDIELYSVDHRGEDISELIEDQLEDIETMLIELMYDTD
jgi:hypothetical protein